METVPEKSMTYLMDEYIKQMSTKEKRAYEIAKSHLQTSFDLEKSIVSRTYIYVFNFNLNFFKYFL